MKLVEIRAAEGGDDAKLLVNDMFDIYSRIAIKREFKISLLKNSPGYILFRTNGDQFFIHETGGHRVQRVPPTERSGRTHTSTITVAALDKAQNTPSFDERKMTVGYYKAPGAGGQKRNKTENACRIQYDGLIVTCCDERSKRQNYELALKTLKERLKANAESNAHNDINATRKSQIGSGQRGDKIRTYRLQDDTAIDHRTGQKLRFSALQRGKEWFTFPSASTSITCNLL